MQKTLNLNKEVTEAQLNVPIISGVTTTINASEKPIEESFLFVQFKKQTGIDPFGNSGKIIIGGKRQDSNIFEKEYTSVGELDTFKIPGSDVLIDGDKRRTVEDGGISFYGTDGVLGSALSPGSIDINNFIQLRPVDNTSQKNFNSSGAGGVLADSYPIFDNLIIDGTNGADSYIAVLPYGGDTSEYRIDQIYLELTNPSITQLDLIGVKKVTKLRTCTVDGITWSWVIEEYVISETPCA